MKGVIPVLRNLFLPFLRRIGPMCHQPSAQVFMSFCYLISTLVFLLTFSFIPDSTNLSLLVVEQDWNIIHIPSYMVLTSAIYSVLLVYYKSRVKNIIFSALLATIMGVMLEIIQQFTGRTMSWEDFLLNEVGVLLMSVIMLGWILKKSAVRLSENQ